jgi:hypothetical protein
MLVEVDSQNLRGMQATSVILIPPIIARAEWTPSPFFNVPYLCPDKRHGSDYPEIEKCA